MTLRPGGRPGGELALDEELLFLQTGLSSARRPRYYVELGVDLSSKGTKIKTHHPKLGNPHREYKLTAFLLAKSRCS